MVSKNPVVDSNKLERGEVWGETDSAVHWAGTGKLYLEDGSTWPVGPGSVFVLPTPMRHDLENTGKETLRAVAFFAAAMFTQDFDQVMLPPKSHILGTPNRNS
jgi:quercetin dioxygenase-like cupin family protein